jgi:hypothetical protein
VKLWHVPVRLATGAYILNSGLNKRRADRPHAEQIQEFASGAYPQLAEIEPMRFASTLSMAEIGVGGALLTPMVPAWIAGSALTLFSVGLLGLYWRTPGMHEEGDLRPTEQGLALAKDSWMLGIGLALLLDP